MSTRLIAFLTEHNKQPDAIVTEMIDAQFKKPRTCCTAFESHNAKGPRAPYELIAGTSPSLQVLPKTYLERSILDSSRRSGPEVKKSMKTIPQPDNIPIAKMKMLTVPTGLILLVAAGSLLEVPLAAQNAGATSHKQPLQTTKSAPRSLLKAARHSFSSSVASAMEGMRAAAKPDPHCSIPNW